MSKLALAAKALGVICICTLITLSGCVQPPKKKKVPPGAEEASKLPWSRPESWQGGGSRFGLPGTGPGY